MAAAVQPKRVRTLFISDIHLGTKGCQAQLLLDFLAHYESEYLYLVGDIVDGWKLRRAWYWPASHNMVVETLLRRAREGVKVFYIPGNHDEMFREYCGLEFGGVTLVDNAIHETADGRKLLVIHGDQFDVVVKNAKWLAHVGDHAYRTLLWLNTYLNVVRRRLGFSYWSLSAYLKQRVKNAVEFMSAFEDAVAGEAKRLEVDGVVCGHIHHAEIRPIKGTLYCNDGDWVESCTAMVEQMDGQLQIIDWAKTARARLQMRKVA